MHIDLGALVRTRSLSIVMLQADGGTLTAATGAYVASFDFATACLRRVLSGPAPLLPRAAPKGFDARSADLAPLWKHFARAEVDMNVVATDTVNPVRSPGTLAHVRTFDWMLTAHWAPTCCLPHNATRRRRRPGAAAGTATAERLQPNRAAMQSWHEIRALVTASGPPAATAVS